MLREILNAMMSKSAKYLKLLPKHEHFTQMLIYECLIYAGVAHALAQIREEYWIPQGRAEVRKALSHY